MNALRFAGLMAGLAWSVAAFSQTTKPLTFEVASIRPASFPPAPGAGGGRGGPGPNRIGRRAAEPFPFISLSDLLRLRFSGKGLSGHRSGLDARIEVDDFGEACPTAHRRIKHRRWYSSYWPSGSMNWPSGSR